MRLSFPFSRYRCAPVWANFPGLCPLSPFAPRKSALSRSERRPSRLALLESLERRELLTAEMSVFEGSTQLYNWADTSFGTVTVGDQATKTFTISDTGDETLEIDQPSCGTGFNVQGSFPLEIDPGDSASFDVSLDTSTAASYSSQLWVDNNTPDNDPFLINIDGTVDPPPPVLSVLDGNTTIPNDPNGYGGNPDDYGTTTVGSPVDKTFEIDNSGSSDVSVSGLNLPGDFSLVGSFPSSVPANGSASFTVRLDADAVSNPNGELSFADTDAGGGDQYQFAITGTVIAPPPVLTVLDGNTTIDNDPYGYGYNPDDFGTTTLGTAIDKTFEITNSGSSAIGVSNLSLPSGFSLVGSFPTSVPANGSATFTVQMDASSVSTPSGELSFADTDLGGGNQYQFAISGTVNAPAPALSVLDGGTTIANDNGNGGNPDDFGTTGMGTPIDKVFTITNSSASQIGLTAGSLSLPSGFSLVGTFPASVPATGSTTFTVRLDATAVSTPEGELSFQDSDPGGGAYSFVISGTVIAAPTAANENYEVAYNTAFSPPGGLLPDAGDPNGDPLTAQLVTGPANGSLTFNSDGTFTYTPTGGYLGADGFTYQLIDGSTSAKSNVATVSLDVYDPNSTAVNHVYSVTHDRVLTVAVPGVLDGDSQQGGPPLAAELVSGVSHGTLTLNADDNGLFSSVAVVTIDVTDNGPVAVPAEFSTQYGQPLAGANVLANDFSPDGLALTAVLVSSPGHSDGNFSLAANGDVQYTPAPNFSGADSFTYRATDGILSSAVVTVTIDVTEDPPAAVGDFLQTSLNTPVSGNVLTNAVNPDGATLTVTLATQPADGTVTLKADGGFTYTPNHNYSGSDSFDYALSNGVTSSTGTVTIAIDAWQVQAEDDSYVGQAFQPDVVAAPGVLANDTTDAPSMTAQLVGGPQHGTLALNADGSFSYTPNGTFVGTDSFTYNALLPDGTTSEATVTIDVTKSPPVTSAGSLSDVAGQTGSVTIASL